MAFRENLYTCKHTAGEFGSPCLRCHGPTQGNFSHRRHGKRFKVPSCLQIMHLEISAVGMVSALNHHRAYGKVHFSGYTVDTLRQFLYHHAYKIFGESRHDASFHALSCLLFIFRGRKIIGMICHLGPYHAYSQKIKSRWSAPTCFKFINMVAEPHPRHCTPACSDVTSSRFQSSAARWRR